LSVSSGFSCAASSTLFYLLDPVATAVESLVPKLPFTVPDSRQFPDTLRLPKFF
jgi:hypothetical protein